MTEYYSVRIVNHLLTIIRAMYIQQINAYVNKGNLLKTYRLDDQIFGKLKFVCLDCDLLTALSISKFLNWEISSLIFKKKIMNEKNSSFT